MLDACVEPVLTMSEAANHPQLQERGMIKKVPNEEGDYILQISSPFRFSKTPVNSGFSGQIPGADTLSIFRELGWEDERIKAFLETGACGVGFRGDSNN